MIYNVNDPLKFIKHKKFFNYCYSYATRSNLKILPDIVGDLYLLLFVRYISDIKSITVKYLLHGCLLNPNEFNRLLTIDITYGLREYFELVKELYDKYKPTNTEEFKEFLLNEEVRKEIRKIEEKYIILNESINIDEAIMIYYSQYMYDFEFEVNYDSYASTPGNLTISKAKSKYLLKSYKSVCNKGYFQKQMKRAVDLIKNGDVQPGLVVSLSPLKVFAYSDEFEGGVMLTYPEEFVKYFNLSLNQKVVFVNNYWAKELYEYRYDLLICGTPTKEWRDFIPLLSILFSDEIEKINTYIANIDEDKWNEVKKCADEYILKFNDYAREGMEYFIEEK